MKKLPVNYDIAITHLVSRPKQTAVVTLGIMIGIGVFIFMNCLVKGFDDMSNDIVFKTTPHFRIYQEDKKSQPLFNNDSSTTVLLNSRITNETKKINNPSKIVSLLKKHPEIDIVTPWTTVNIFYNNGSSQLNGVSYGVNIKDADAMFEIKSNMIAGNIESLLNIPNGIILANGIVERLNIRLNDNITIVSSIGTMKIMKVVGIFKTTQLFTSKSLSYMNFQSAQQLMGQGPDYLTDIYVNIKNPEKIDEYKILLHDITGYYVEDWKTANESIVSAGKTRTIMMRGISIAILIVAAFGIYNILNMTIMEKIKDIAILKATGFSGKDVVYIFVSEAIIVGIIGLFGGLILASIFIKILSNVYVGGDFGYFPIKIEPSVFIIGACFGLFIIFLAGYLPARKAAKLDPVSIFRK